MGSYEDTTKDGVTSVFVVVLVDASDIADDEADGDEGTGLGMDTGVCAHEGAGERTRLLGAGDSDASSQQDGRRLRDSAGRAIRPRQTTSADGVWNAAHSFIGSLPNQRRYYNMAHPRRPCCSEERMLFLYNPNFLTVVA